MIYLTEKDRAEGLEAAVKLFLRKKLVSAPLITETMKLKEYCSTWLLRRSEKATVRNDRSRLRDHVLPHIGEMRVDEIRPRHIRQVVTNDQWQPSRNGRRIECRQQVMAFGGSYLRGFDENLDAELYAEQKMLPPRSTGGIVLEFHPIKKEIKIII